MKLFQDLSQITLQNRRALRPCWLLYTPEIFHTVGSSPLHCRRPLGGDPPYFAPRKTYRVSVSNSTSLSLNFRTGMRCTSPQNHGIRYPSINLLKPNDKDHVDAEQIQPLQVPDLHAVIPTNEALDRLHRPLQEGVVWKPNAILYTPDLLPVSNPFGTYLIVRPLPT